MLRKIFDHVNGGMIDFEKHAQTGSEEPHPHERKLAIAALTSKTIRSCV